MKNIFKQFKPLILIAIILSGSCLFSEQAIAKPKVKIFISFRYKNPDCNTCGGWCAYVSVVERIISITPEGFDPSLDYVGYLSVGDDGNSIELQMSNEWQKFDLKQLDAAISLSLQNDICKALGVRSIVIPKGIYNLPLLRDGIGIFTLPANIQ